MSQTAGQADAAAISAQTARQEKQLWDLAGPTLSSTLRDFIKDLGPSGSEPGSVKTAFDTLKKQQADVYSQEAGSASATVGQLAKQGGERMDPGAAQYGSDAVIASLEQSRRATARQTKEAEVDASLQQKNFLLSQILGVSEGGVGQSFGLGRNAIGASQYNTSNPGGGALSGAIAGAGLGTEIYPGWGTLIGAGVGALGGYFAGRG